MDSVAYPVIILSHGEAINFYVTGEGDISLFVYLFIYLELPLFQVQPHKHAKRT
jgi:hypothetical protein